MRIDRLAAGLIAIGLAAGGAQAREIALTFDDAPRGDTAHFTGPQRGAALRAALTGAGVEGAVFFCISGNMDAEGRERVLGYQQDGHYLANHSATHKHPAELGLEGYLADVAAADAVLRPLPGFLPLYRFPYLDEGREVSMRDGLRAGLAALGYTNGYVTVDTWDWYMDSMLQAALAAGRAVDWERLRAVYVGVIADAADFYDGIAVQALGHSPRHVLLLHENDLAALYLQDVVAELRARGWDIIPGPRAFEDPIAGQEPDTLYLGQGRVAAIAEAAGMPHAELAHRAEDAAWLETHFAAHGVFGPPAPAADGP